MHPGDGGAGNANRRRRGAGRVTRQQVVGDIAGGRRERRAPVLGGPLLPGRPRGAVCSAGVVGERGQSGVDVLPDRGTMRCGF